MDVRTFWLTQSKEAIKRLAHGAGTTVGYVEQLAGRWSRPSPALAQKLVEASGGVLTLHELRPDIWTPPARRRPDPPPSEEVRG